MATTLHADDGDAIRVLSWRPEADAKERAVIQLLHGLGEHASRYERFAKACNARGLVVVAHNHRGHGDRSGMAGHYADRDGWDKLISDALLVRRHIRDSFPNLPIVLFGHSMGSYIAQSFVMRHAEDVALLILSGSTYAPRSQLQLFRAIAAILGIFGRRRKSGLLDKMGFGAFNKPFLPARTDFDWLSRDESEVDEYVEDPLCGGLFTNQLWLDLMGGLLEITSTKAIRSVPADLPILILGGERDPVGGERGLSRLADVYRQAGHENLTLKIYQDGRHEMLNEINRDEVTRDIIDWILRQQGHS